MDINALSMSKLLAISLVLELKILQSLLFLQSNTNTVFKLVKNLLICF